MRGEKIFTTVFTWMTASHNTDKTGDGAKRWLLFWERDRLAGMFITRQYNMEIRGHLLAITDGRDEEEVGYKEEMEGLVLLVAITAFANRYFLPLDDTKKPSHPRYTVGLFLQCAENPRNLA